ncbi:hypothetical protein TNCV_1973691 [Trichonephila clavipes]|nr:hypothetical protein TNCV_1973691 [Trichonephila clavipes]
MHHFSKFAFQIRTFQSNLEQISPFQNTRYSTTNRIAPLAVRSLAASAPAHGDGTLTGTEVIQLAQPITELPLANARKEQRPQVFTIAQYVTNSCYPIGQAVKQPETLIGRGNCKLILKTP